MEEKCNYLDTKYCYAKNKLIRNILVINTSQIIIIVLNIQQFKIQTLTGLPENPRLSSFSRSISTFFCIEIRTYRGGGKGGKYGTLMVALG
jgi:hypothetical protein